MNKRRNRARNAEAPRPSARTTNCSQLRNPFPPMDVFTADRIEAMHEASLDVLERLGMTFLLPEAVAIFKAAGALVTGDMVYLGREIVEAAIASAPTRIEGRAGGRNRDIVLELGSLVFQPGAGAPHATDEIRGRRPGSARDFQELIQLTHHYDVFQMLPPLVEPQDVATNIRHYFTLESQLTDSDKFPFIFSRGAPQVMDSFEMLRDFRGLSDDEFADEPRCYTIINTNSPRTLDIPMAQGLIDFARAGQISIVTPFTLMGAMGFVAQIG